MVPDCLVGIDKVPVYVEDNRIFHGVQLKDIKQHSPSADKRLDIAPYLAGCKFIWVEVPECGEELSFSACPFNERLAVGNCLFNQCCSLQIELSIILPTLLSCMLLILLLRFGYCSYPFLILLSSVHF